MFANQVDYGSNTKLRLQSEASNTKLRSQKAKVRTKAKNMSEINENIAPANEAGAGSGGNVPLGHKTADYYFDLPKELIAQDPNEQRDGCRMLCIDRNTGELEHKVFHDIIDYLEPGETLVLNNTRVIPARLLGT